MADNPVDLFNALISAGEIVSGACLIAIGAAFAIQSWLTPRRGPTALRAGIAFLFIVGGLEELFDAAFSECGGIDATVVHATCTLAQLLSGIAAVALFVRARMFSRDFAHGGQVQAE